MDCSLKENYSDCKWVIQHNHKKFNYTFYEAILTLFKYCLNNI